MRLPNRTRPRWRWRAETQSPLLLTSPAGGRPSRVRLFPCPDRCTATDDVAASAVPCRTCANSDLRGGGPVASAPRPPPDPVRLTAACPTSPACRISGGRIHAARPRNARRQALAWEVVIEQAVAAPAAPLRHDIANLGGRAGGTCRYGQDDCGYDRNIGQRLSHRHLLPLAPGLLGLSTTARNDAPSDFRRRQCHFRCARPLSNPAKCRCMKCPPLGRGRKLKKWRRVFQTDYAATMSARYLALVAAGAAQCEGFEWREPAVRPDHVVIGHLDRRDVATT